MHASARILARVRDSVCIAYRRLAACSSNEATAVVGGIVFLSRAITIPRKEKKTKNTLLLCVSREKKAEPFGVPTDTYFRSIFLAPQAPRKLAPRCDPKGESLFSSNLKYNVPVERRGVNETWFCFRSRRIGEKHHRQTDEDIAR